GAYMIATTRRSSSAMHRFMMQNLLLIRDPTLEAKSRHDQDGSNSIMPRHYPRTGIDKEKAG
ncbi:MAG TPA: hypothetical protein VFD30_18880, partial [Terriglobia bacterium]|nr:hypothetical protein [Terriglobia bacterium]